MHRLQVLAVALSLLSLHTAQGRPVPGSSTPTSTGRSLRQWPWEPVKWPWEPEEPVGLTSGQKGLALFLQSMLSPQYMNYMEEDVVPATDSTELVNILEGTLDSAIKTGLAESNVGTVISAEEDKLNPAVEAYVDATLLPIGEKLASMEAETKRLLARATVNGTEWLWPEEVVAIIQDPEFQAELFTLWSGAFDATSIEAQDAAHNEFLSTLYDILDASYKADGYEVTTSRAEFIESNGDDTSQMGEYFKEYPDLESLRGDIELLVEAGVFDVYLVK